MLFILFSVFVFWFADADVGASDGGGGDYYFYLLARW